MLNIDWTKLVNIRYWLEGVAGSSSLTPVIPKDSPFFTFFVSIFSAFVILGIILTTSQVFMSEKHPFQKQFPMWSTNLVWMGVLGLVWFTLRTTSVGFLGARIWLLFGLLWFLVLLYLVIRYFIVFFPLEISYFNRLKNK